MSVDDVWGVAAEPAMEAEPAARVGEAFAHAEAGEWNAGGLEFAGRVSAGAGEGDKADAPAAMGHALGEQNCLTLGTRDAVDPGEDDGKVVHCWVPARVWSMMRS